MSGISGFKTPEGKAPYLAAYNAALRFGFGNDGTESTGPRKSNYGNDHMKKKGEDVVHGWMVSKLKSSAIQGSWGIRHGQVNMTDTIQQTAAEQ